MTDADTPDDPLGVCAACDRSLAPTWTYCPACGFDTRDTPAAVQAAADGGTPDAPTPRRVRCAECGWVVFVEHGAIQKETPVPESAAKRRAGHIAGKGCPADAVTITPVDAAESDMTDDEDA